MTVTNTSNKPIFNVYLVLDIRSVQTNAPFALGPGIFATQADFTVDPGTVNGDINLTYDGSGTFFTAQPLPVGTSTFVVCAEFELPNVDLEFTRIMPSPFAAIPLAQNKCGAVQQNSIFVAPEICWPCGTDCPIYVEWDSSVSPFPPLPCQDCSVDGRVRYARDTQTSCLSHICVNSEWSCLGVQNDPSSFVTVWRTSTIAETVRLPVFGPYDIVIDWGDGSNLEYLSSAVAGTGIDHVYATAGDYVVRINGSMATWNNSNANMNTFRQKLVDVLQFGTVNLTQMNFRGATLTTILAPDAPQITITNMSNLLREVAGITDVDLNHWDVSNVTTLEDAFRDSSLFNGHVEAWNVSSVTTFAQTFRGTAFNRDIGAWNVSSAVTVHEMFFATVAFNQDLGAWNTGNVVNFSSMFRGSSFNQDIGGWDVTSGTQFVEMFRNSPFNQDISLWDMTGAVTIHGMFRSATAFSQDITGWDVSNISGFGLSFMGTTAFNQPLGVWDVGNATNMENMFSNDGAAAAGMNQDLSGWPAIPGLVGTDLDNFMRDSGFDQTNYDLAIVMFEDRTSITGTVWPTPTGAGGLDVTGFSAPAQAAYTALVARSWTITA